MKIQSGFFQDSDGVPESQGTFAVKPGVCDGTHRFACATCALLSVRGDDMCYDCLMLRDSKDPELKHVNWWNLQRDETKPDSWVTMVGYDDPRASYIDDLVISEDDVLWASSSEAHRLASVAGSFDYVYDLYDNVVDISELWNTPQTSESFYLDNSWHKGASL